MTTYLVDNSFWQHLNGSTALQLRMNRLMVMDLIVTCPPQVLEYCYSARNAQEYIDFRTDMESFMPAEYDPSLETCLDIQQALWDAGLARSAQSIDTLIAAYAVANDAILLSCDTDYGFIEAATNGLLRQEYIAP